MLAPDALNSHMAGRQIEFALQASRPEGGQLPAQGKDPLLDVGGSFLRRVVGSAAVFEQAGGALLLVSSPPLAHCLRAGAKQPCGGLNAPLSYGFDQSQAVVIGAFHLTNQIEVAGGHRPPILSARAVRLLPLRRTAHPNPNTKPTPLVASGSCTSALPGGNDVPFQFHLSTCLYSVVRGPVKLRVWPSTEKRNGSTM